MPEQSRLEATQGKLGAFCPCSVLLITMLLIDWLAAVDYHGPLVTRCLMMRGASERKRERERECERERYFGKEGGRAERWREGWKLDELGLPSTDLTISVSLISYCLPRVCRGGGCVCVCVCL